MTPSQFYTNQFYSWEYRGRGWFLADAPIHLEAPFIPYYRHGYPEIPVDDGKRHTVASRLIEQWSKPQPTPVEEPTLSYNTIEPFVYDIDGDLAIVKVILPKERKITPEKTKAMLVMLSSIYTIVSFEIIGTHAAITIQFVCSERYASTMESYVTSFFPFCTVFTQSIEADILVRNDLAMAVADFGLQHEFIRLLNTPKNFALDPLSGFISILEKLPIDTQAGMQILIQPTFNEWSDSIIRSVTMRDGSSFFIDVPDAPKMAIEKVRSPLCAVTIRVFAQAPILDDAFSLLERIAFTLMQGSKGGLNTLQALADEAYDFETRVNDIMYRESHRLGMLLNVDELVSLVHFPSESIHAQKLFSTHRKTKGVPIIAQGKEYILGINTHNTTQIPVTIDTVERLKHMHIIGTTGTGKSTLLAQLVLQDIEKGNACILFDPHGDLVDDILSRVPRERIDDVIYIDPSDTEYAIGLNILQAHSDVEKEVLASDIVAIFKRFTTSWGDQMSTVLANAVLALLHHPQGGSLHDLRRFLLEKQFRENFLKQVTDQSVQYFWHNEYPLLKSNSIGPILTRLNTFLRSKTIRMMLVQKKGLDFTTLFNSNKIILCKLSQGLVGTENSFLLGSLLLSKVHQAILQRQQQNNRSPLFLYLDEFQNFITPSIAEMITGIRKYNAGLILSHQDLHQLQRESSDVLNSVLSNCATRICFRVGDSDSKRLQEGFLSFEASDLQNLSKGEAIIRIEQPQYDCSLDTIPLPTIDETESQSIRDAVRLHTQYIYATPIQDIDDVLFSIPNTATVEQRAASAKEQKQEFKKPEKSSEVHTAVPLQSEVEETQHTNTTSTHRYLQTLVKKMAEARGYTATLEVPLPSGTGYVDVLLAKDSKRIAVEICNTTNHAWEAHNITKCIEAQYEHTVSLSGDIKQLEKIKQSCIQTIPSFETYTVSFFTPDALFTFLDQSVPLQEPDEMNMKGYRVTVSYDPSVTTEEMTRKRSSVSDIVRKTLRNHKKNKS